MIGDITYDNGRLYISKCKFNSVLEFISDSRAWHLIKAKVYTKIILKSHIWTINGPIPRYIWRKPNA